MSRRKNKYNSSFEPIEVEEEIEEEIIADEPVKKGYIAVKGISLDKFKARFRPGDPIPTEYLEDPDVDFDNLLSKGAIREIGSI